MAARCTHRTYISFDRSEVIREFCKYLFSAGYGRRCPYQVLEHILGVCICGVLVAVSLRPNCWVVVFQCFVLQVNHRQGPVNVLVDGDKHLPKGEGGQRFDVSEKNAHSIQWAITTLT
jgi:hypothetical protein